MALQVDISVSWGSTTLLTRSFTPPRTIDVGQGGIAVPAERIGAQRLPLIVARGGRVYLVVWPRARGTVTIGSRPPESLNRAGDAGQPRERGPTAGMREVLLPGGSRAEIVLAGCEVSSAYRSSSEDDRLIFQIEVSAAPRSLVRRMRGVVAAYAGVASVLVSLAGHSAVLSGGTDLATTPAAERSRFDLSRIPTGPTFNFTVAQDPRGRSHLDEPLYSSADEASWWFAPVYGFGAEGPRGEDRWRRYVERWALAHAVVPEELRSCFPRRFSSSGAVAGDLSVELPTTGDSTEATSIGPHGPYLRSGGLEILGWLSVEAEPPWNPYAGPPPEDDSGEPPRWVFGAEALESVTQNLHDRTLPAFEWCYHRALADRPGLRGRVRMHLGSSARPARADAQLNEEDPALVCCLEASQRLWGPRAHGTGEIRYSITLSEAP